MWAYLNELLAYATYYYEYILEVAYGNRYVVRFGQLKRTAPTGGELCRQNKRVEIFEFAPGSWKKHPSIH
jgi:hypothetical protein